MSEYQFVAFQAVDQPLDDRQLDFARRQSSRAEVSRWSLSVEYNFGSFRGNVDGLLRQGYDVYLEYTNYGSREIRLRLPGGQPCADTIWSRYVDGERLEWTQDADGRGGILAVHPLREEFLFDDVPNPQAILDAAIQARDRLLRGDLRPLYVLWLCATNDDSLDPAESIEPPVPHGLASAEMYGPVLLSFFGNDPLLLTAAAAGVESAPSAEIENQPVVQWVESLRNQRAKELLVRILVGDTAAEKARLLAEIRDSQDRDLWPTEVRGRSVDALLRAAAVLRAEEKARMARKAEAIARREAAEDQRRRAERMTEMVKDPQKWIREAERLVEMRGTQSYDEAAEILQDLRQAVGGAEGARITRRHAARLAKKFPTLSRLKGALRKRGLLD